jgi:glycogen debranching enzyme
MAFLSREMNDPATAQKYETAYAKGFEFINKSTSDGGLWNGEYYCQLWKDGRVNDHLLEDQTIGILFNAVPADRAEKIIQSLNTKSRTAYGVAETFPYYTDWRYAPGTYHNGAVWPWLNFMDCWARIRMGRKTEALEIIKTVAQADLVASGDWSHNEHINSLTGENLGFILQGWNANLFGLVYFGWLHPDMIP